MFLVTVEEVPRRQWTPGQPIEIGPVGGVLALLTGVTVDDFVHVHLAAAHAPTGSPGSLVRVDVAIDDGHATRYEVAAGEHGGTGTEEVARQSFRPRPPAGTDRLLLTLRAPDGEDVRVPVRL